MNNIKFIFLGLAGIVTLGSVLLQLYVWITMYGIVSDVNRSIDEAESVGRADPSFNPQLDITGADENGQQKSGFVALTSYKKMHDYRYVSVDSFVRVEEMLEAGEELPAPELLPAFVTARVVRFADAECKLLKQNLAAECAVASSQASLAQYGLVDISFSLNFIQKGDFGTIKAAKRAAYVEIEQSLIEGGQEKTISYGGAENLRSVLYGRAVNFCAKIRNSEGNCAISNVRIHADPYNNNGTVARVTANASFAAIEPL